MFLTDRGQDRTDSPSLLAFAAACQLPAHLAGVTWSHQHWRCTGSVRPACFQSAATPAFDATFACSHAARVRNSTNAGSPQRGSGYTAVAHTVIHPMTSPVHIGMRGLYAARGDDG